jgi:effector-binding domain-containing protein
MDYRFRIHETDEQPIASIRERRAAPEIPGFLGRTFGTLFERLGRQGVAPVGPPFVIYHEFGPDAIDAEVCVPVGEVVAGGDVFTSRVLPAATVVRTLHVGPYDQLGAAYGAMTEWIQSHGTEGTGPVRERYLNGPSDGAAPADYQTELEMPVAAERLLVEA